MDPAPDPLNQNHPQGDSNVWQGGEPLLHRKITWEFYSHLDLSQPCEACQKEFGAASCAAKSRRPRGMNSKNI